MENTQSFLINSWNTNQILTDLPKYIATGTERNGLSISCLQEFHYNNFSQNPQFSLEQYGENQFYVIFNKKISGIFTYSVGMASSSNNIPRTPKRQDYGTLVIWNSNIFDFHNIKVPSYFMLAKDELGMRTTPWVTLCTKNFKLVNIMSIHGYATNKNKKDILFKAIFNDIMECNIPTLIVGDFNYEPMDLSQLIPPHLKFNPIVGATHINPETKQSWCIDHVVTNKYVTINNLKISGIDQKTKCMKSLLAYKKHDHGILSFKVEF